VKIPVFAVITFLIFCVLFTSAALSVKLSPQMSWADEVIVICISGYVLLRIFETGYLWHQAVLATALLLCTWMGFGIYNNKLPSTHILQIFIYFKILLVFLFFHLMPIKYRERCVKSAIISMCVIAIIVVASVVLEVLAPTFHDQIFVNNRQNRGIYGFYLTSIWGHRVGLANFSLISLIVFTSLFRKQWWRTQALVPTLLFFCILLLTFSRKEILFGCLVLYISFFGTMNLLNRVVGSLFSIAVLGPVFLWVWLSTEKATTIMLTPDYIRWKMVSVGAEALSDSHFLGTGVGTFGSQLSRDHNDVYYSYDLFNNRPIEGAPIFDIGYLSTITELGLGFVLVVILFIMLIKNQLIHLSGWFNVKQCFWFMALMFVLMGLFTPILTNWVGLVFAAWCGMLTIPKCIALQTKELSTYG